MHQSNCPAHPPRLVDSDQLDLADRARRDLSRSILLFSADQWSTPHARPVRDRLRLLPLRLPTPSSPIPSRSRASSGSSSKLRRSNRSAGCCSDDSTSIRGRWSALDRGGPLTWGATWVGGGVCCWEMMVSGQIDAGELLGASLPHLLPERVVEVASAQAG